MSILFKGNLEEGNYTLIKSTDGWVLKGETSYVGFNFADRSNGEWTEHQDVNPMMNIFKTVKCSVCGYIEMTQHNYCPNCGARMKGADE